MSKGGEPAISAGKGRLLQVRRGGKGRQFSIKRQLIFLDHFAATCNVTMSAEAAGIDPTTAYRLRRRNEAFRQAWRLAQDQGYVALEADLVRRARDLLQDMGTSNEAEHARSGMDAKLAHALLQRHQHSLGREPGDTHPRRSDLAEATKRLEKAMARLRLLEEEADAGSARGE
jgi:3-hydroxyisobutyrate dehydrogenase-like beta-hydroxyacid dehydrogenase